ncbi:MAG TPA: EAL domain-containing protein [Thermoanaerobaculia bacterium]
MIVVFAVVAVFVALVLLRAGWLRLSATERALRESEARVRSVRESQESLGGALNETSNVLRAVFAASPMAIVTFGADGNVRAMNPAAGHLLNATATEVAKKPFDIFGDDGAAAVIRACAETGAPFSDREVDFVREGDPRIISFSATALRASEGSITGVVVLARDVTERKRRTTLERLLHEVDRQIVQSVPIDSLLQFTCSSLVEILQCPLVQLSLRNEDGSVGIQEASGPAADFVTGIEVRWDESEAGRGPTGTAIRTGAIQSRDLAADPHFEPWRARANALGLAHALAIPLNANDSTLGAITLFSRSRGEIDADDIDLLVAFADQIALSLIAASGREEIQLKTIALESAANAVLVTDASGEILWVNQAFTSLTGYTREDAIGSTPRLLKSGNHTAAFYRNLWDTVSDGRVWSGEMYNRRKDGTLYIEEQTITPVRGSDGSIWRFVAIKQDITARKRQEEQVRFLAMHDPLTELPNRRALDAKIERVCWSAARGRAGALLILDLDNFKPVNDTVGHMAGDQVLAELASLLRDTLRPGDFLARLGGDEFAVLLEDTSLDGAVNIAQRMRAAVDAHRFQVQHATFECSMSIGVAPIDADTDGSTAMIRADSALYAAKQTGKDRVVAFPFGGELGASLAESNRWAMRIKSALRDGRFALHYQPVVRLGNGEAEHYEALIRLIDEEGELIAPDEFLTAAQRFGLMPQIDRWVVENVMKVLESVGGVRIFVNISGASLCDDALLAFIERRIADSHIPPGRLAFEITESAAVTDLAAAQNWISKLKDLGCLFALDDFGVGFSSFSYLRALSADYVKIDKSFVADLDVNPTNRALVLAVKTVAQTLGKEVIAEGVENEAHATALREIGVELGQGYKWGSPRASLPASPPPATPVY